MQWILQDFEDTQKLATALDRLGLAYSWHKVVPFVGELQPEPVITDRSDVVLFGSYTLWRYAEAHNLTPGVYRIEPFVEEAAWHPFLLNGPEAKRLLLRDIPATLSDNDKSWFIRPVEDSKEEPGKVRATAEIIALAQKVLAVDQNDIPNGSLRHDTELMLTAPARIQKEWRIWVVADQVVTMSLYKEGTRVMYRPEIDEDARAFAKDLVAANPGYAPAYVLDICRTDEGLRMLETNCINAAGFYAADLMKLAAAIEGMDT